MPYVNASFPRRRIGVPRPGPVIVTVAFSNPFARAGSIVPPSTTPSVTRKSSFAFIGNLRDGNVSRVHRRARRGSRGEVRGGDLRTPPERRRSRGERTLLGNEVAPGNLRDRLGFLAVPRLWGLPDTPQAQAV